MPIIKLQKQDILNLLPHTGLAQILDNATIDLEAGTLTSTKKLRVNSAYCKGHYPGNPIFPGYYQEEAIRIAAALLCKHKFPGATGFPIIRHCEKASFKQTIIPGDTIEIVAKFIEEKHLPQNMFQYICSGSIYKNGKRACVVTKIVGMLL